MIDEPGCHQQAATNCMFFEIIEVPRVDQISTNKASPDTLEGGELIF